MPLFKRPLIIIFYLVSVFSIGFAQPETTCPGTQASRLVTGEQARVITLDGINLRELPDIDSRRINTALRGDLLTILEGPFCSNGLAWWRVEYESERAWTAEGLSDVYFLAPYILQHAQVGSLEITARPELVDRISASTGENRVDFALEGYPVREGFFPPLVRVFDNLPDLDEVAAIEAALTNEQPAALPETIQAVSNIVFLDLPEGQAVRYTSLFLSTNLPDTEPILLYSARGITRDGRYISFNLPIRTPNLPRPYQPQTTPNSADYLEAYLATHTDILNALPSDAFTPNLALLDDMLRSITIRAISPPRDDALQFIYFDSLRFDYTPQLARTAIAEQVSGIDSLPRHIAVFFNGYPVTTSQYEPALRVYSSDFIEPNRIIRLNLLLSQRLSNPSAIPIPLFGDAPQAFLAQLTYREFRNGSGVRFLTTYVDDTMAAQDVFYSFQGVTDNSRFYISAVFPLSIQTMPEGLDNEALSAWLEEQADDTFNPPLSTLDALIASLQMRVPSG